MMIKKWFLSIVVLSVAGFFLTFEVYRKRSAAMELCPPGSCCVIDHMIYDLPSGDGGMILWTSCGWFWMVTYADGTGSVFACPTGGSCTLITY